MTIAEAEQFALEATMIQWPLNERSREVNSEVDVGSVTGGFAEGGGARKRRYRSASKSHADLPRLLARSIARARLLKIGAHENVFEKNVFEDLKFTASQQQL